MEKKELQLLSKNFLKEDMSAFTENLSSLIRIYGISELAQDAGFNRISLWRYMKGEPDIKLATFAKILKALGIRVTFESDAQLDKVLRFLRWQKRRISPEELEAFEQDMASESKESAGKKETA